MLGWLGALAGTVYTAVAGYLDVRRREGPAAARRRWRPLLAVTAVSAAALAIVASTSPGDWWNYLLVPGSAFEWYGAAVWLQRQKEGGGIRIRFARVPLRHSLLILAGLGVFSGVMDLRAGGVGLANLLLFAVGLSNLGTWLVLERHRPGVVEQGILLHDRLIPWEEIEGWRVAPGPTSDLVVRTAALRSRGHPQQAYALRPEDAARAEALLRERLPGRRAGDDVEQGTGG